MIVATAGTTNAGEIDDMHACRKVADKYGLHLHVDAAWAGALVIDPVRKQLLAGIELADSVTIDAHKWMSVTMGTGMIFIRDSDAVSRAYSVSTGYMPAGDGADPYINSNQWSRRFVGLRLWMVLRTGGTASYRQLFKNQFKLAVDLRNRLAEDGWRIENHSPIPVVLFDDDVSKADPGQIADELNRRGKTWVGTVQYEGRTCLRVCFTSFLSNESSLESLTAELDRARSVVLARGKVIRHNEN